MTNVTLIALLALTLLPSNIRSHPFPKQLIDKSDFVARVADSNTAFFEGAALDYVIYSPPAFKMIVEQPVIDGYSLAFVPETESYDSNGVMIAALYYDLTTTKKNKLRSSLDKIILADTSDIRMHYDSSLFIGQYPDTVLTITKQTLSVFYFEDTARFIPNVMTAYFDGDTEVLIFELTIALGYPRFEAEDMFLAFLRNLKALNRGTLGE